MTQREFFSDNVRIARFIFWSSSCCQSETITTFLIFLETEPSVVCPCTILNSLTDYPNMVKDVIESLLKVVRKWCWLVVLQVEEMMSCCRLIKLVVEHDHVVLYFGWIAMIVLWEVDDLLLPLRLRWLLVLHIDSLSSHYLRFFPMF